MSSYSYKDNTKEVLEALERAKERGLEAIGINAERHAKKDPNMPVDTGLARNSIAHAVSGKEKAKALIVELLQTIKKKQFIWEATWNILE